jgi:hypothetical protein
VGRWRVAHICSFNFFEFEFNVGSRHFTHNINTHLPTAIGHRSSAIGPWPSAIAHRPSANGHRSSAIPSLPEGKPVYILVIDVHRGLFAHRRKPLGAIRSHPDGIPLFYRVPMLIEHINSLSLQVQQAVFHNVGFNERKMTAGIVCKNIHRHVERVIIR